MPIEWRDTTWHADDDPPFHGPETREADIGGLLLIVSLDGSGSIGWVSPLRDEPMRLAATDLEGAKVELLGIARGLVDPIHAALHEGD